MVETEWHKAVLAQSYKQSELLRQINENLEKLVKQESPESRLADKLEQELKDG